MAGWKERNKKGTQDGRGERTNIAIKQDNGMIISHLIYKCRANECREKWKRSNQICVYRDSTRIKSDKRTYQIEWEWEWNGKKATARKIQKKTVRAVCFSNLFIEIVDFAFLFLHSREFAVALKKNLFIACCALTIRKKSETNKFNAEWPKCQHQHQIKTAKNEGPKPASPTTFALAPEIILHKIMPNIET